MEVSQIDWREVNVPLSIKIASYHRKSINETIHNLQLDGAVKDWWREVNVYRPIQVHFLLKSPGYRRKSINETIHILQFDISVTQRLTGGGGGEGGVGESCKANPSPPFHE